VFLEVQLEDVPVSPSCTGVELLVVAKPEPYIRGFKIDGGVERLNLSVLVKNFRFKPCCDEIRHKMDRFESSYQVLLLNT